jgi:hypothetical protein
VGRLVPLGQPLHLDGNLVRTVGLRLIPPVARMGHDPALPALVVEVDLAYLLARAVKNQHRRV